MPEIVVELVPDLSQLQSGLQELTNSGVISKDFSTAFKAAQKPIDDFEKKVRSGTSNVKKDFGALQKQLSGMSKSMGEGFKQGVEEALKDAGVSMEEFLEKLKQTTGTGKTLKQELKEMTVELARMKLAGQENTKEYAALIEKAGQYRDTLSDVAAETRRVGSDTRNIDTVIEVVQGLGAAYQIAQGAAALLGEGNEELQRGLLKLQAIMAITNGVQQIQNLLQKESNVVRFANIVGTKAQIAVQQLYTFVTGRATAATLAFKVALATTGIGLVVIGILALVNALKQTSTELEKATDLIDQQARSLEGYNESLQQSTDLEVARAELVGAAESKLIAIRGRGLLAQRAALVTSNSILAQQRDNVSKTSEAWFKLNNAIEDNNRTLRKLDNEIQITNLNFLKTQNDERKEQNKKDIEAAKERNKKLLEAAKEQRAAEFADFKAGIELRLLEVEKGSAEELALRKKLLNAELLIQLENEKLTLNQRKLLIQTYFKEVKDLTASDASRRVAQDREHERVRLAAQLQNLSISSEERLALNESLLEVVADQERAAAQGNADKIREINAQLAGDIARIRLAAIQEELAVEERLQTAIGGIRRRALEDIVSDTKAGEEARLDAVDELADKEIETIKRKQEANKKSLDKGLITQREYNVVYEELKDAEAQVHENAEKRKTQITEDEKQKRIEKAKEEFNQIAQISEGISEAIGAILSTINSNQNLQLEENRKSLDQMRAAGAITEKEYQDRLRKQEIAERQAKRKQAQREKELQLFNAFIAGGRAIVEAAPNPFLIAITAALVAAQIAAIASRQIPKFGKGIKSAPRGLAEVGETGTELIQTGNKYYVADHPQVIWMKGGERIYNPKETETIMNRRTPMATIEKPVVSSGGQTINEARLAKQIGEEIAKHPRNIINLDENGFSTFMEGRMNKTAIRNKQFTFND